MAKLKLEVGKFYKNSKNRAFKIVSKQGTSYMDSRGVKFYSNGASKFNYYTLVERVESAIALNGYNYALYFENNKFRIGCQNFTLGKALEFFMFLQEIFETEADNGNIQNLVSIAINEGEKTSNKLKALELIGKMSEVSLFSETKTHVHLHSSADIKSKLIEGLRNAFNNTRSLNDQAKIKAQSLLLELDNARTIDQDDIEPETPTALSIPASDEPTTPLPPKSGFTPLDGLHSIPDTRTNPIAESQPTLAESGAQSLLHDLTITAVIVTNPSESNTCASIGNYPKTFVDGEGVLNPGSGETIVSHETPPLQNPIEKG